MLSKTLRISSHRLLLAAAALALCPLPSHAQSNTPVFKPAGEWTVGRTEISNVGGFGDMKMPCVVSNEYDNGFIVRFSGGGKDMLALAIDFRQDVFTQGRKYTAMLAVGDGYVKQVTATAFTANTLIFNLRPLDDFYAAVKKGGTMELNIDSNSMKFSLDRLSKSYAALESCYAGGDAPVVKPMVDQTRSAALSPSRMRPVLVPGVDKVMPAPLPSSFNDIVRNSDQQAAPMDVAQAPVPRAPDAAPVAAQNNAPQAPIPARISRAPAQQTAQSASSAWSAKAGEDMRAVLSRWSDKAGYDFEWQADQNGKVVQDIAMNGSFEDAVSQLLAESGAMTGVAARVDTDAGSKKLAGGGATSGWKAAKGASVQSILNEWGAREGVAIVWEDSVNMPVKTAIATDGSFETAVQSLLDQYSNDSARPVGRLNRDPETGQRTLMMNMDVSG